MAALRSERPQVPARPRPRPAQPRFGCAPANLVRLLFFFQAEDGIRDLYVTGVQTCALPIFAEAGPIDILVANAALPASGTLDSFDVGQIDRALDVNLRAPIMLAHALSPRMRSEERRVGKSVDRGGRRGSRRNRQRCRAAGAS